jgi:hypothetical protein
MDKAFRDEYDLSFWNLPVILNDNCTKSKIIRVFINVGYAVKI